MDDQPQDRLLCNNGSTVRTDDSGHNVPPCPQAMDENGGVASKDVVLDSDLGLWVRLYLPPHGQTLLPLIIFFHGGGFCFGSPSHFIAHRFCLKWAASIGAIIVSVKYRLAPEHRLPAAYEDSFAAVEWLRCQSIKRKGGEIIDPWLDSHADFSHVYLMGDSAGGNIAHHVGMWAAEKDWEHLQIRGMILLHPFFGGEERTASEIACPASVLLNLEGSDKLWREALPIGENKDNPFSNPLGPESPNLDLIDLPPLFVVIGGRDLLRDRVLEYCRAMKKCGKQIQVFEFEEENHSFTALKLEEANSLKVLQYASDFIKSIA
eukprot:Gb_30371 [translate_table: standard]